MQWNLKKDSRTLRPSAMGPHLLEEEKERIFERLYRLDNSISRQTGGSGFGLAIVEEIIGKHDGQVGLCSEDGINTFWFALPIE